MAGVEARAFDSPDETRTPDKTRVEIVRIGSSTVARMTLEPGWRWSECIKPLVASNSINSRWSWSRGRRSAPAGLASEFRSRSCVRNSRIRRSLPKETRERQGRGLFGLSAGQQLLYAARTCGVRRCAPAVRLRQTRR